MPDWTYRTIFRPLLFRLPAATGRDMAVAAIGTVPIDSPVWLAAAASREFLCGVSSPAARP